MDRVPTLSERPASNQHREVVMSVWFLVLSAFAGDCEKVAIDGAALSSEGVRALAIRDVRGSVAVVGGDGAEVKATGKSCADGAIRLVKRDGVVTLVVKGGEEVALVIEVPRGLAVGVYGSVGPVDVRGTASIRVANTTGPVNVEDVRGAVFFDHVVGTVTLRGIGGEVASSDVTGGVQVL